MKINKLNNDKYMKKILLIAVVLLTAGMAYGQTRTATKVGYVDYALLRDTLPATDTFEYEIQAATIQFQQQIGEMQQKLQRLQSELDTTTYKPFVEYLQKDMNATQQKMQEAYQQAEYVIGQLQQQAVTELNQQISVAVSRVAKARKYTIVLDSSNGSIVYGLPQDDLTKAVAQALKIRI